jgi:transposase-like protein
LSGILPEALSSYSFFISPLNSSTGGGYKKLDFRRGRTEDMSKVKQRRYTQEERTAAIELYLKYDRCVGDTIRELGYPSWQMLYYWYSDYLATKESGAPHGYGKYTEEQKRAAVEHYLEYERSQVRTIRALGYPDRELLAQWVKELAPETCKTRKSVVQYSSEQKVAAVIELCTSEKSASEIACEYNVSHTTIQRWKSELLSVNEVAGVQQNDYGELCDVGLPDIKENSELPKAEYSVLSKQMEAQAVEWEEQRTAMIAERKELESELYRLKLEVAILKGAAEIIKKTGRQSAGTQKPGENETD